MKNTQLLLIFTVTIVMLATLMFVGCDEGMNMVDPVITDPITDPGGKDTGNTGEIKKPGENENPGEQDPGETETPESTITIAAVMQADDKSVTISGTSTDVPEGTKVTIVLGDDAVTVKAAIDENGAWTATVPAQKTAQLAPGTIAVTATAKKAAAESSFEIAPPADTTPPTVVKVGWHTDSKLFRLMLNDRQPGATMYVKVVFSEPVEHIVGNDASARPALSLVIGGQATRLRVLPHNAGNKAFVSGTCQPLKGDTDTFACKYTVPAGSIGTVALQVGEETADTAGNAIAESQHIAPFMIQEPEPPKPEPTPLEVVPALKTLVPAVAQEHLSPPESNPGDFVGQVRTLYSSIYGNSTQPLAGVSVTITEGSRVGEEVTTDQGGYYRFPSVSGDELYLRVEKEHFEPKEVIVHRTRSTVSQRPTGPILDRIDPWHTPGTVVMGQRWPDAIRFIFEETALPDDVLFVRDDGYRSPESSVGRYAWSGRLSGIVSISADRIRTNDAMLMVFAHELGHAHQHAVEIANNADTWEETPEGRAYARARERDWAEMGRSPLDQLITNAYHEAARLLEGAAEVSNLYWGRGKWAEETAEISKRWSVTIEPGKDDLATMAPNRYEWAEAWLNKQ